MRLIVAAATMLLCSTVPLPVLAGPGTPCSPGYFSGSGLAPCNPCPGGYYQSLSGQTGCIGCNGGTYSTSASATCTACNAGTYSGDLATSCTTCDPGTYSGFDSAMCTTCGPGQYSAAGAGGCSTCAAGTYSASGAQTCSPCSAGYYSDAGAGVCIPCPAGTYAANSGSPSCTNCAAGTFELSTASSMCDACPGGAATPCNGNGTCSDGPTGDGTCSCNYGYSGSACQNTPTTTTLPSGACPAEPAMGCVLANVVALQIQKSPALIKWKWQLGSSMSAASLGDPGTTTQYTLCIYDETALTPALKSEVMVPPGSYWTGKGDQWTYKDKPGSNDGVTKVLLKASDKNTSKAMVTAKGALAPVPTPVSGTRYFAEDPGVIVQLLSSGGPAADQCWSSAWIDVVTSRNDGNQFKGLVK
ncbi:MAG TPA: hypothetical protein VGK20_11625 [Candidatus Binatia bacterium]|jgi:hypothetical protein